MFGFCHRKRGEESREEHICPHDGCCGGDGCPLSREMREAGLMSLRRMKEGQKARIAHVQASGELGRRIRDMGLIPGAVTLLGVLIATSRSQAVTETKLDELTREVREHNNFARRMPVLEERIKVANHRIDDLEHEKEKKS